VPPPPPLPSIGLPPALCAPSSWSYHRGHRLPLTSLRLSSTYLSPCFVAVNACKLTGQVHEPSSPNTRALQRAPCLPPRGGHVATAPPPPKASSVRCVLGSVWLALGVWYGVCGAGCAAAACVARGATPCARAARVCATCACAGAACPTALPGGHGRPACPRAHQRVAGLRTLLLPRQPGLWGAGGPAHEGHPGQQQAGLLSIGASRPPPPGVCCCRRSPHPTHAPLPSCNPLAPFGSCAFGARRSAELSVRCVLHRNTPHAPQHTSPPPPYPDGPLCR
jgi:hypothetical protein